MPGSRHPTARAVISFGDDLLCEGPAVRVNPVWLVGRYGAQSVSVPVEDAARVGRLVDILAAEAQRPQDASSVAVQRDLLLTLLPPLSPGARAARSSTSSGSPRSRPRPERGHPSAARPVGA